MDALSISVFVVFFGLVIIRVPIAVALTLGALIPVILFSRVPPLAILQKFFTTIDVFSFMAIPLFIFCGGLLEKSGVSGRLCDFTYSLVGWLPGGIAIVTFVTSMFFGAVSGSATATVLAVGSIMVPMMIDQGYGEKFALACIAVAGILGVIIPPSIPMVVFGMTAGVSISDLFTGGIIPGIMLTAVFSLYSYCYGRKNIAAAGVFEAGAVWRTFKGAVWGLLMPVIILGGIYGGIFTPTEAAAVASIYGIFVGFVIYRQLSIAKLYDVLKESVTSSSMIMFIVAAAAAYGYVLTRRQIPLEIAEGIIAFSGSSVVFMLVVNLLLLLVGTFMETCAAILILTPMLVPACKMLGIDLTVFGVVMVINLAIGMVTPPLGLNLFVAARLRNRPIDHVVNRHLSALIALAVGVLLLLTFFPSIILFLRRFLSA
ncbi:MAG: TRAP transporter large permease subunit [Desulfovibrio sp.]|jgi:C4-dicarboxylate transporter DctM subunit|nr:TRAP transporter large permease subunit [Desulfovibrio sp.]